MKRFAVATAFLPFAAFAQGPLPPPVGPPVASMRSLDQIEPRLPIPVAGPFPVMLSASGSYSLTGNLAVTVDAIVVDAADVTIDLNGFTISASGVTPRGIVTTANARRLTLSNGTIRGGGAGIDARAVAGMEMLRVDKVRVLDCAGIALRGPVNSHISGCEVRGILATTIAIALGANSTVLDTKVILAGGTGFSADVRSVLTRCHASGAGTTGIFAADQSTLDGCTVSGVSTTGIQTGRGSTLDRCSVADMTGGVGSSAAIKTGIGSRLSGCVARSNAANTAFEVGQYSTVRACVAINNTGSLNLSYGFDLGSGSSAFECVSSDQRSTFTPAGEYTAVGFRVNRGVLIKDCTANENRGAGIIAGSSDGSIITGNICRNNGLSGTGSGIALLNGSDFNRIEGNHVTGNDKGILINASSTQNIVARNTVGANTTLNWDISAGNFVAPVVSAAPTAAFTGNTGGGALGSVDPNANITLP